MKIKNLFRHLAQILFRYPPTAGQRPAPQPSMNQPLLDLDEPTDSGLPLREAIPVRSAEYWMEMGYPELAMEELETLSERASRHAWPRRVRLQATLAAAN